MHFLRIIISSIAIGLILFISINLFARESARNNAKHFLTHVTRQNYDSAFNYLYYFNNGIDQEVSISYEEAKGIWVNRVKSLKEDGTYIKSFNDLVMRPDDSYQNGYVTLTVVQNGKEQVYEDIYIAFVKSEGRWIIANLSEHNGELLWEKAYRGYVGEQ